MMFQTTRSIGFTTLELLFAAALTVMLMAAILSLIGSINRAGAVMADNDRGITTDRQHLVELFRRDLAEAQSGQFGNNLTILEGFCSLDQVTLQPTHRPVRVRYEIQEQNGRFSLVRRQTELDRLSSQNEWSELVCQGIREYALEPLVPSTNASDTKLRGSSGPATSSFQDRSSTSGITGGGQDLRIARSLRLTLVAAGLTADQQVTPWQQDLILP